MELEIWSDVACPWCYVGKRRLEAALTQFEHRDDVSITWRSFELDPSAPPERTGDRAEHLARKYGMTVEQARERQQELAETAAGDGLEMRFEIARAANTFDAHRLVHLAGAHGRQDEMKERLMQAHFTDGELVSGDEVSEMLAGDRFSAEVRDDERTASELGISAVPTFVVDRAMGASGAYPPDALLELLRRGWAARPAATPA